MKTEIFILVILAFLLLYVNTLNVEAKEIETFKSIETGIDFDKIPCFSEDLQTRNYWLTVVHISLIMFMIIIIIYQKNKIKYLVS